MKTNEITNPIDKFKLSIKTFLIISENLTFIVNIYILFFIINTI